MYFSIFRPISVEIFLNFGPATEIVGGKQLLTSVVFVFVIIINISIHLLLLRCDPHISYICTYLAAHHDNAAPPPSPPPSTTPALPPPAASTPAAGAQTVTTGTCRTSTLTSV